MLDDNRREMTLYAISRLGLKSKTTITPNTHQVMVSCPFHKDKSPSMGIDVLRGVAHCFSCSWSGSIEKLYKELTNGNLRKELGYLDDPFTSFSSSLNVQYITDDTKLKDIYINADLSLMRDAYTDPTCAAYLRKRGIPEPVAKSMGFKYADDILINNNRFRNRLLIPVYEDGRLISIEGRRILDNDETKVLYPRNSSVNTLFDIDNLDTTDTLYAVEGLMDLAVLRTSSVFKNSTSIFGANITRRQIELFKRFPKIVYIPDSDAAGEKTVEKLKAARLGKTYILRIPKKINNIDVKDVGDLTKAGIVPQDLVDRNWLSYEKFLS